MAQVSQAFPHLHVIITAVDYGTGLWPIARADDPSCFAPPEPGSKSSLLTEAVRRMLPFTDQKLTVVTAVPLVNAVKRKLTGGRRVSATKFEVLALPGEHGSATALAIAAARIRRHDPDAVVCVVPGDLAIEDDNRLRNVLYLAYQVALRDRFAVLAAEQQAHCGSFSYFKRGRVFGNFEGAYAVRSFQIDAREQTACRAKASGACWYTGIFMARAAFLHGALVHASESARVPEDVPAARIAETASFFAVLDPADWLTSEAQVFLKLLPTTSFEQAAFTDSASIVMVPTSLAFTCVRELRDVIASRPADEQGNRVSGKVALVGCENVAVTGSGDAKRTLCLLGLEDVVVVETGDVCLVAKKDQLGRIDEMIDACRNAQ